MKDTGQRACNKRRREITAKDLPLCCPLPNERVWDAHPRVYLPIEKSGHEFCPYCGQEYILKS
ncbi:MAG: zinc-finger domain-containing protein [Pseudomonadota bacterium]